MFMFRSLTVAALTVRSLALAARINRHSQFVTRNSSFVIGNYPGSVMDIGSRALSNSSSERTFFCLATWRTVLPEV